MNIKTVFRMILPLGLMAFGVVHAQEIQVPEPQMQDIQVEIPDVVLPDIHVPTALEQVQTATDNFIESVRTNIVKTASGGYVWYASGIDLRKEVHCLAQNIYYEARGESMEGKLAIVNTTLNRVKSLIFPQTVCGVVWQPLQFSWTSHKLKYKTPHDQVRWQQAQMIAEAALEGGRLDNLQDVTEGATQFHATRVHPKWRKDEELERTVKIGNHIFYRLKPTMEARNEEPVAGGGE